MSSASSSFRVSSGNFAGCCSSLLEFKSSGGVGSGIVIGGCDSLPGASGKSDLNVCLGDLGDRG